MIYLNWAFLFNITHALLPDRRAIVEKGYLPLLDLLEEYPEVTCEMAFTGYTSEWLLEHYPELVARVRAGIRKGKYRPCHCTYCMGVSPALSLESITRQIRVGLEVDEAIWSVRPQTFYPPLCLLDCSLIKVLADESFRWAYWAQGGIRAACSTAPYYPSVEDIDQFLPLRMRGLGDKTVIGLPCFATTSFLIMEGGAPVAKFNAKLAEIRSGTRSAPPLLVMDEDGEMLYVAEYVGLGGNQRDQLRELIEATLNAGDVKQASVEEYLAACAIRQDIFVPPAASGNRQWTELMDRMCAQAEQALREAEFALETAGAADGVHRRELDRAWKRLLFAQNTDARQMGGFAGQISGPYPALIRETMEAAGEAQVVGEALRRRLR